MNLPNKLTCLRMVMIVPFVIVMLAGKAEGWSMWVGLILFLAASFTDMLDGKIARKYNLITDFGKFMDPLADKLLVCSAMIILVDLGRLPSWVCIVIIAREFIISGFRLVASDNGIVIAASMWGKVKTVTQMAMIVALILHVDNPVFHTLEIILIAAACALTIISLVDYIMKNRGVLSSTK